MSLTEEELAALDDKVNAGDVQAAREVCRYLVGRTDWRPSSVCAPEHLDVPLESLYPPIPAPAKGAPSDDHSIPCPACGEHFGLIQHMPVGVPPPPRLFENPGTTCNPCAEAKTRADWLENVLDQIDVTDDRWQSFSAELDSLREKRARVDAFLSRPDVVAELAYRAQKGWYYDAKMMREVCCWGRARYQVDGPGERLNDAQAIVFGFVHCATGGRSSFAQLNPAWRARLEREWDEQERNGWLDHDDLWRARGGFVHQENLLVREGPRIGDYISRRYNLGAEVEAPKHQEVRVFTTGGGG